MIPYFSNSFKIVGALHSTIVSNFFRPTTGQLRRRIKGIVSTFIRVPTRGESHMGKLWLHHLEKRVYRHDTKRRKCLIPYTCSYAQTIETVALLRVTFKIQHALTWIKIISCTDTDLPSICTSASRRCIWEMQDLMTKLTIAYLILKLFFMKTVSIWTWNIQHDSSYPLKLNSFTGGI